MKLRSRVSRAVIHGASAVSASSLGRRPPVEYLSRLLDGRIVPRAAQAVFSPGLQHVNGISMWIAAPDSNGAGGEYHMALGTYEEPELQYVLRRLPVGGGMVDAGAHIGYFTLAAAARVGPTGTIIAIEPTPSSADILRKNVAQNVFDDRVTVVEAAASNVVGSGTLLTSDVSAMWNTLEPDALLSSNGAVPVGVVTIDSVVSSAGRPEINLIKMDVEGHERSVLEGAAETIDRNPRIEILFEVSGTSEERFRASMETVMFLREHQFEMYRIADAERGRASTVDELQRTMRLPRWQDSLANIIARRPPSE